MSGLLQHHPAVPSLPGIGWFFTTRQGGHSEGDFASWNLGHHVGDDPGAVAANRQRLAQGLGVLPEQVCYLEQVHGTACLTAQPGLHPPPVGDALVTRQAGLVLAIMVADCVPVLLADGENRVIGAAHAGWRGALSGVLESCLEAMVAMGSRVSAIHAIIGPCIRGGSYQVGEELRRNFLQADSSPDVEKCFTPDGESAKFLLDMPGYVAQRLLRSGLEPERIHDLELCTYASADLFFSFRRSSQQTGQGRCGRQVGGLRLL